MFASFLLMNREGPHPGGWSKLGSKSTFCLENYLLGRADRLYGENFVDFFFGAAIFRTDENEKSNK